MRLDQRVRITRSLWVILLLGWVCGSAIAHTVQAEPDLISLPWLQIAVGVIIASWGGATATLGRYLVASYDQTPFHWRSETVRDGFVSVTVGAGSYMAGAWYGLSAWQLGLVLLLSGYLGVRLLTGAAERLMMSIAGKRE